MEPSTIVSWAIQEYDMNSRDILIFLEMVELARDTTPEVLSDLDTVMFQAVHYCMVDYLDNVDAGPDTLVPIDDNVKWAIRQIRAKPFHDPERAHLLRVIKNADLVDDVVRDWILALVSNV